jgi:hypothetical protein
MLKCVRLQELRSAELDVAKDQAHAALIWVATSGIVMAVNVDATMRIASQASNRPWRPIGMWDVEAPTSSRQSAHIWR